MNRNGIIKNMREILPMWRMCRILKENRAEWVAQIVTSQVYDNSKHKDIIEKLNGTSQLDDFLTQETTLNLIHEEEHSGDLKVNEGGLLITYIQNHIWKHPVQVINISSNKKHQKEILEARVILRNCINHNPSFIKQDGKYFYLSSEGEGFASDWFGLFREYIKEIGPTWAIISGFVIAITPYISKLVVWLYQHIEFIK